MVCHVCGTLVNLVNRGRYLKSTWKVPEKYLERCNTKIRTKNEWKVMGNIWAGLYNTKNHLTTVADVAIATRTSANIISFFTTLNIITPASPGWALFCLALASCLYCPPIGFKIYPSRFTNLTKMSWSHDFFFKLNVYVSLCIVLWHDHCRI